MPPVAPLLVAAVFATMCLGLVAAPTAVDSPLRPRLAALVLPAVLAALLAAAAARLPAVVPLPESAAVGFLFQAIVVTAVAIGVASAWRRSTRPPALPLSLRLQVAGIGAVAGVAAQTAATPPAVVLLALATAAALAMVAAVAPALRERLDAGDAPSRVRGRPLAVLSAAIAASAVAAALAGWRG